MDMWQGETGNKEVSVVSMTGMKRDRWWWTLRKELKQEQYLFQKQYDDIRVEEKAQKYITSCADVVI